MRYATQADADPNASSTKMARESCGLGAGNSWAQGNATGTGTKAPIRIFTLGRFSIAIDDRAVRSKGKAKHRPLGLLKALIAQGGRDVASSRLCECLWLDESAIGKPSELQLRLALNLYAGHFLAREFEESWMFAPRLRLKTKFERLVAALATHLERENRFSDAMDVCLQALGRDPLNELLYRRLMGCYLKRGELAEAARIYSRCREALAKGLAMQPSMETERLYLSPSRALCVAVARCIHTAYQLCRLRPRCRSLRGDVTRQCAGLECTIAGTWQTETAGDFRIGGARVDSP